MSDPRLWVPALVLAALTLPGGEARSGADPALRWQTLTSDHFEVHFYQELEPLAEQFLAVAEEAWATLRDRFGFEPGERVHLVVTDDQDSANGLALVVPYNHITLYAHVPDPADELGFWGDWRRILVYHELVHIFHLERVKGPLRVVNLIFGKSFLPNAAVPNWFVEGLAVLVESSSGIGGRIGSPLFRAYLRTAVAEGKPLELDEMTGSPLTLPRGTIPYLYGSHFLGWLADEEGEDKLVRFIEEQAGKLNPLSINISARRIFGRTFVELYEEWRAALTAEMEEELKRIEGAGVSAGRHLFFAGENRTEPAFARNGELLFASATGHERRWLMRRGADGVNRRLTHCRGGCNRPQEAVDGTIFFSANQSYRTYYYFQELHQVDADGKDRQQLTAGGRVKDPAISPDGLEAAFIRTAAGTSQLIVRRLESGAEESLWELDGSLSWPAWSPDGKSLAVAAHQAGASDIWLVDRQSGGRRNLTPGPSLELQPTFTPDGRWLIFTSSRTGVFNLHALSLTESCLRQLTNVVGASWSPAVSPDGKRLVHAVWHRDGYHLYELDLAELEEAPCRSPGFEQLPGHRVAESLPPPIAPPPPDRSRYCPLLHVRPHSWRPTLFADSWDLTEVGLSTAGADPVGQLSYQLSGQLNTQDLDHAVSLSMSVDRWFPSLALWGSYNRRTYWARANDYYQDYQEMNGYLSFLASFPVRRTEFSAALNTGYIFNRFAGEIVGPWEFDPGSAKPSIPLSGQLSTGFVSVSFDNTESYAYSVTNERGISAATEVNLSLPLLGSNWTEYHWKWRATGYLPLPWADHHVLMTQMRGAWSGGRESFLRKFGIGGYPEQDIISDLIDNTGISGTYLRGYPASIGRGTQYYFATADYYFPVWRIRRGWQTFPIFVKDLYADLFANGGAAFNHFDAGQFKWGAGAELRLKLELSYYLQSTLIVGAAYGFQEPGGFTSYFLLGR